MAPPESQGEVPVSHGHNLNMTIPGPGVNDKPARPVGKLVFPDKNTFDSRPLTPLVGGAEKGGKAVRVVKNATSGFWDPRTPAAELEGRKTRRGPGQFQSRLKSVPYLHAVYIDAPRKLTMKRLPEVAHIGRGERTRHSYSSRHLDTHERLFSTQTISSTMRLRGAEASRIAAIGRHGEGGYLHEVEDSLPPSAWISYRAARAASMPHLQRRQRQPSPTHPAVYSASRMGGWAMDRPAVSFDLKAAEKPVKYVQGRPPDHPEALSDMYTPSARISGHPETPICAPHIDRGLSATTPRHFKAPPPSASTVAAACLSIPTLKLDGKIDIDGTDVSPSGRGPAPAPTTDERLDWFRGGLKRFPDTIAGKGLGTSRVIAQGEYLDLLEGTAGPGLSDSTRSLAGSASQPDLRQLVGESPADESPVSALPATGMLTSRGAIASNFKYEEMTSDPILAYTRPSFTATKTGERGIRITKMDPPASKVHPWDDLKPQTPEVRLNPPVWFLDPVHEPLPTDRMTRDRRDVASQLYWNQAVSNPCDRSPEEYYFATEANPSRRRDYSEGYILPAGIQDTRPPFHQLITPRMQQEGKMNMRLT